jgi:transposase
MLPNKPRDAPRVNDRRVLDGIFWYRSGARWRDLPECDFEAGGRECEEIAFRDGFQNRSECDSLLG